MWWVREGGEQGGVSGQSVTYIWAPPVSPWQGWCGLKHTGGVGVGVGGHAQAYACIRCAFSPMFCGVGVRGVLKPRKLQTPFCSGLIPFASLQHSHAYSHRKRGRDGSDAPAHSLQYGSCSLCPPAHWSKRVCVHSQHGRSCPEDSVRQRVVAGLEQFLYCDAVNEHRPTCEEEGGCWGGRGRRWGDNNSDPCSKKTTTQRALPCPSL